MGAENASERQESIKVDGHLDPNKTKILSEEDVAEYKFKAMSLHVVKKYIQENKNQKEDVKILDFGCGRGVFVAALRAHGYVAYGADIVSSYIDSGNAYLRERYPCDDVLLLMDENSNTTFPDGYFDVVITDQVLEHVADLDCVVAEISRISKPGALGLHMFPAQWRVFEVHLMMPFVHWLPKNRLRKAVIRLCLLLKIGKDRYKSRSIDERVEIIYDYSINNTYYRSKRLLRNFFRKYELECDVSGASYDKLIMKFGNTMKFLLSLPVIFGIIINLYSTFFTMHMYSRRM